MNPSRVLFSKLGKTLPLEEFLFQKQLKSIYKVVCREIYKSHEKADLMEFMRSEFKLVGNHDLTYRKYLLNQGMARINDMANVMGMNIRL